MSEDLKLQLLMEEWKPKLKHLNQLQNQEYLHVTQ